jgi:heptosyltransferase-2
LICRATATKSILRFSLPGGKEERNPKISPASFCETRFQTFQDFSRRLISNDLKWLMKLKLLVVELWALGDLVLATPFLNAAARQFEVTLLAKPTALELQPRLWPGVEVIPFVFPWTAFRGKYRLHRWQWRDLSALARRLRSRRFDLAVSARPDARDHLLLRITGAKHRVGFPHIGSSALLTEALVGPGAGAHRYGNWRVLGRRLGLELPPKSEAVAPANERRSILIHSGAAQPTRVWPLDRFAGLADQLRRNRYAVEIACDPSQRQWWASRGENVCTPANISELIAMIDRSGLFVGNDSGPGHLAAILGIPTFTLFGNQFASSFLPIHPAAQFIEGDPCPFKPCYDSCRFARPECLFSIEQNEVWLRLKDFAEKQGIRGTQT